MGVWRSRPGRVSALGCPADPPAARQVRPAWPALRSDLLGLRRLAPAAHLSDGHFQALGRWDIGNPVFDFEQERKALLVVTRFSLLVSGPSAWVLGDCYGRGIISSSVTLRLPGQSRWHNLFANEGFTGCFQQKKGGKIWEL